MSYICFRNPLAARSSSSVVFWDWESGEIVRRVDVEEKHISWSGIGNLVTITADDSFYILRFDRDAYSAVLRLRTHTRCCCIISGLQPCNLHAQAVAMP